MRKLYLLIKCKNILFTATMCLFSTMLNAQTTIADIREQIAKGECEIAQSLYNVYKAQEKKTDYELERQINDCLANKGAEGKDSWGEGGKYLLLKENYLKSYSLLKHGKIEPTEKEWYNTIMADIRREYPNRMIGIVKGEGEGSSIISVDGRNYHYGVTLYMNIVEPNIHYYLNMAIRNAKKGSKIALNQIMSFGTTDEYLKNQMIDILMDEGYRVVNNVSNADYCINLKMSDDFLQIQLVNSHTGEYEGVASVKFEGFLEEKEKKEEGDVYSRSLHFKGVVSPPH